MTRGRDRKPATSRVLEIGPKLKAARKKAGLSLRVLASRTDFSASFLSQVELGQVSPSLHSLERLAEAVGVPLAGLFAEGGGPSAPIVHRQGEDVVRSGWSRATMRVLLAPWPGQAVSAMLVALEPGGQSAKAPRLRSGRSFAFCVSGKVVLETPTEKFELSRGDSICYETSTLPSMWRNVSAKPAELFVVSLPG
jgi:transcriptional regulator with XRE-family HTH domain